MPLSTHVSITITEDSVGADRAGFGVGLLLSYNASSWTERVRTYSSLAEVAVDFPVTTGPEYLAAQSYFSQSPRPETLKIGRGALPATLRYTFTPVVANTRVYKLYLKGDGVTATTASYTSDASATAAEIVTGLTTAVNAAVGKNFTATGTTTLVITGDAAGEWFSVEVDDVAAWTTTAPDHADPGVATDLAAISVEDDTWYLLLTNYNSKAYVGAAAAYIEAQKKLYAYDSPDVSCPTVAIGSADDIGEDLFDLGYDRTFGTWKRNPAGMHSAGWAGSCLPLDPGSETWAYKELAGVAADSLTSTHRTNLDARNMNYYYTVAGVDITWQGKAHSGEYIDVTRGLDWLESEMQTDVFEVLVGNTKVPYTDAGVAMIEAAVRGTLKRAATAGVIDSDFTVTVPKVADVSAANKTARNLPDVKWTATLAGAIHKVTITGVVSV